MANHGETPGSPTGQGRNANGEHMARRHRVYPEAIKEASAYCQKSGKNFKQIHVKEIPAGVLGRWPESELLFRCE